MKMKLNALSLAVAAGFIGSAAQAADVALFPYVVNSATVTTIVSIVDQGTNTNGYTPGGAVLGPRLHWRLNYKGGANATNNAASCEEVNWFLPSSPNDIQTVDIGGKYGSTTKGVLFNDPSTNNNWNAGTTATINYMLGANAASGSAQRGVLFVHNAEDTAAQTLYGEAMILDFSTGAAWGYQALLNNNGAANNAVAFNYEGSATGTPILTFMPRAETTTRLFVTPVNRTVLDAGMVAAQPSMLEQDGSSNGGTVPWWNRLNANLSLVTGTGVAYDRDENLVSGSAVAPVVCVGAVDAQNLMTAGAATTLANGGWGQVRVTVGNTTGAVPTTRAILTKLEFNTAGQFNGTAIPGTFNNGFIMR